MTTPASSAAQNGLPGNLDTTNASAQINQFLGTHGISAAYDGTLTLNTTVYGNGGTSWVNFGNGTDLDQPFTLSGTSIGRVTLPLNPVGNGANVLVTLYPDNGSGSPNTATPLASTMVTAEELLALAAPNGIDGTIPLANEDNNSGYIIDPGSNGPAITTTPYATPSASGGGSAQLFASWTSDGNFFIAVGGQDNLGVAQAGVATIEYQGDGVVALPTPQPALPIGLNAAAVTICNGCVVVVGGGTGATGNTLTNQVLTASWDNSTGLIGTWSTQTVYPISVYFAGAAGYGNYVYVAGGQTGVGPTNTAAVYSASVTNGQVSAWQRLADLPVALNGFVIEAVNGWLIAMGGLNAGLSQVTTTYYAQINGDGTIGPWQNGPTIPYATSAFGPGFTGCVAGNLVNLLCGNSNASVKNSATMAVTATGLGAWQSFFWNEGGIFPAAAFPGNQGQYDIIALRMDLGGFTEFGTMGPVPLISVPLYATGLTNGSTYHVVMRQFQNATSSDYTEFGLGDILSGVPNSLVASRHGTSWSTYSALLAVPISVYNTAAVGNLRHLWQDPDQYNTAQQTTSLLYDNLGLLIGELDVTMKPNNPLNSNPTFTSGVSPWTVTNGTFTQSSTQTHGGFAFSGLLTPTGGFTTAFVSSEQVPVSQGRGPFYGASRWYLADGWFYSTPGWPNFQLNVNWYDHGGNFLSTTTGSTVSLAAATWTHVQAFAEAPATAAFGAVVPAEFGSPNNTRLLYCSDVFLVISPECVGAFTSAATVDYANGPWPPTSVTQLL